MARGNQREKAREKTLKEQAGQVGRLAPLAVAPSHAAASMNKC